MQERDHRRRCGGLQQFLADLEARLARFGLNLHPDETRLIEFGRSAIANRYARGLGKPETFHFLGFTHYCATRWGFVLGRKPLGKRMRTKLREIKEKLMATRHDGIDGQGQWLAQVLRGWMAYYAVPTSGSVLSLSIPAPHDRMLARRSHAPQPTAPIDVATHEDGLPIAICHSHASYIRTIQGGSPVR